MIVWRPPSAKAAPAAGRPALFLDRDGIVNVDHGWVHRIEDFEPIAPTFALARRAVAAGAAVVVVTNQAGIAKGFYDEAIFLRLTAHMADLFTAAGAPLDAVYACPHHPDGVVPDLRRACGCRKPEPGLVTAALADLGLDPARALLLGDKASDMRAARRAGVATSVLYDVGGREPTGDADLVIGDLDDPRLAVALDGALAGNAAQRGSGTGA